jgi:acyl carrier protein
MAEDTRVEDFVYEELRRLAPRGMIITPDKLILKDLKLIGDDAGQAAVVLQERLGIKVPLSEWNTVWTVQDLIDLLQRYLRG